MHESDRWVVHVLDRARIGEDDVVVDVGPETGALALGALDRIGADGSVVCLEHSADRLDELRASYPDPRLAFLVGDPDILPLPDAYADVTLMGTSAGRAWVAPDAARELYRVLRPRGRLSLYTPVEADENVVSGFAEAGFVELDVEQRSGLFLAGTKP